MYQPTLYFHLASCEKSADVEHSPSYLWNRRSSYTL
jgi:hypothetical protein